MFERFLGVFDVWNYLEQVQNPPNYATKCKPDYCLDGVMFLKHSIMHEKIIFFDKYVYIITIIIKIL